jgi:hypothetical protein
VATDWDATGGWQGVLRLGASEWRQSAETSRSPVMGRTSQTDPEEPFVVTARMIVSIGERRFAPDCKDYWTPAHGPGRGGTALPLLSAICKVPSSCANPSSACAALSQAPARRAKKGGATRPSRSGTDARRRRQGGRGLWRAREDVGPQARSGETLGAFLCWSDRGYSDPPPLSRVAEL